MLLLLLLLLLQLQLTPLALFVEPVLLLLLAQARIQLLLNLQWATKAAQRVVVLPCCASPPRTSGYEAGQQSRQHY